MDKGRSQSQQVPFWDGLFNRPLKLDVEILIIIVILAAAFLTRFYDLEARVMSHDESLHTYYSWQYAEGSGFAHDPLMHGPLQFHLVSLAYTLFGDSDAVSRFPAALAGTLSVAMVILFRRWLGKWGAISAAAMMLVSPFMLYYSRYVRNEAFVVLIGLVMFLAVFRYVETRRPEWIYILAACLALHYVTKETSYIYAAQLLLFLGVVFTVQALSRTWLKEGHKWLFIFGLIPTGFGLGMQLLVLFRKMPEGMALAQPADPAIPAVAGSLESNPVQILSLILLLLGMVILAVSLLASFGSNIRVHFPYLDLLLVTGTLTLPLLASLPAWALGWNPQAYYDPAIFNKDWALIAVLILAGLLIGILWDWRRWLIAAAIFFGIFVFFQTSIFTNPDGLLSGFFRSLGYWLEQQGVERGSQPWYYYLLIQIPLYEFLPAVIVVFSGLVASMRVFNLDSHLKKPTEVVRFPVVGLLVFWTLSSILAYTIAGEKMPWLTVHLVWPMILLAGWCINSFVESLSLPRTRSARDLLTIFLLAVLTVAVAWLLGSLLAGKLPFQGKELESLTRTNRFLASIGLILGVFVLLRNTAKGWEGSEIIKFSAGWFVFGLWLLTARTAIRAAYIHYDQAVEPMVYAHSARGVKDVMEQVNELSIQTTGDLAISVAYDDDVSWPFTWYLRDYYNKRYVGGNLGQELLEYPLLIIGDNYFQRVEPILRDRYLSMEMARLWWPTQDYWNLDWPRVREMLLSSAYRSALFDIWLDRDYRAYGELRGIDFSLQNWTPSDRMRFYVRTDFASEIWDYRDSLASLSGEVILEDPYAESLTVLKADLILGGEGTLPGEFRKPRGVAVAADGTIYVADTGNHRIQRFGPEGEFISAWGEFADTHSSAAVGVTFNEPWGIAVGGDGSVYVADTWNYRVQRFSAAGEFLGMFGEEGQGETPFAFWGPRALAIAQDGRVFVADTGNHRVVIFSAEGEALGQFGMNGYSLGEFNEPVGIELNEQGRVYVADTWNQRIQVFESLDRNTYTAVEAWDIAGWYGRSLENKPYLAISGSGMICATDPEGYRVLCFNNDGEFQIGWGTLGFSDYQFSLINGVDFDSEGRLWVVDSGNHRVMRFTPEISTEE